MATVLVQNSTSCFFWLDHWKGQALQQTFPELFSFCKNTNVSVYMVKSTTSLFDLFHLPLSPKAFEQFQSFDSMIHNLQLNTDSDQWQYVWGSNLFSSNKAYKVLMGRSPSSSIV
jgi:hypothetical protein